MPTAAKEKAVNTAGQEGRQRKTGEIGPDGEQKGAEKVAESGDKPRPDGAVKNGCGHDRHKIKADLDVPGIEREKAGQDNLKGGEHREGRKRSCTEAESGHKKALLS